MLFIDGGNEHLPFSSFKGGLAKLTWELGRTEAEVSHDAIMYVYRMNLRVRSSIIHDLSDNVIKNSIPVDLLGVCRCG